MKKQDHVRTRHDEWGKRAFLLWLKRLGDVQLDARIAGESRRGDVLYTELRENPAYRRKLGLLGELARGRVLFETFRNPPSELELQGCVLKAVELKARDARAARRAKQPQSSIEAPMLCVITPSMSAEHAWRAGATRIHGGTSGLYALAPMWRTVIVAVNELPEERSTLWLRLLGRGAVQAKAVRELAEMSARETLRDATIELLVAWQQSLPPPAQQSEEERELTMNLEQVYERWERKVKAEGRREGEAKGKAEGKAEAVLVVLAGRGLTVTAEQRKHILGCGDLAEIDRWLSAAATTPSAEALLSGSTEARAKAARRGAEKRRRNVR